MGDRAGEEFDPAPGVVGQPDGLGDGGQDRAQVVWGRYRVLHHGAVDQQLDVAHLDVVADIDHDGDAGPFHHLNTSGPITKKTVETSSRRGPEGIAQTAHVKASTLEYM